MIVRSHVDLLEGDVLDEVAFKDAVDVAAALYGGRRRVAEGVAAHAMADARPSERRALWHALPTRPVVKRVARDPKVRARPQVGSKAVPIAAGEHEALPAELADLAASERRPPARDGDAVSARAGEGAAVDDEAVGVARGEERLRGEADREVDHRDGGGVAELDEGARVLEGRLRRQRRADAQEEPRVAPAPHVEPKAAPVDPVLAGRVDERERVDGDKAARPRCDRPLARAERDVVCDCRGKRGPNGANG